MGLYQYAIRLILSSKYCNLEIPCLFCKLENKYSRFYTRLGYIASSFLLYLYSFSRYHHFKKRPYPKSKFLMRCRPESGNKFDKAATLVVAPKLDDLAPELYDKETRPASTSGHQQTVRQICGHPVGRVPKELSAVVRFTIDHGWEAHCWYLFLFHRKMMNTWS